MTLPSTIIFIRRTNGRLNDGPLQSLRYGEKLTKSRICGIGIRYSPTPWKEISYNNLVDIDDAAIQLIKEFPTKDQKRAMNTTFAIIKHTNVCGIMRVDKCFGIMAGCSCG
jgi:phosphoribosylaminoimidazolecarboxamide formyltransferase/IMP cyclohydrolase